MRRLVAFVLAWPSVATADITDQCLAASEAGQDARLHDRLRTAHARLGECAAAACPALVRDDCAHWLEDVDRRLPSIMFHVVTPHGDELRNVEVRMDGALLAAGLDMHPIAVDPGAHVFRFEAPNRLVHIEKFEIKEGEHEKNIRVVLYDESEAPMPDGLPKPNPGVAPVAGAPPVVETKVVLKTWSPPAGFWISGAIGVGMGGLALGTWMASLVEFYAMRGTCAPPPIGPGMGCPQGRLDGVEAMRVVAVGSAIASVLAFAGATTIYFIDRNKAMRVGLGKVAFEVTF